MDLVIPDKIEKKDYRFFSLENLLLLAVVWSSGGATEYQGYFNSATNLFSTAIIFILCAILINRHRNSYNLKKVFYVILFLFAWGLIGTVVKNSQNHYFYLIVQVVVSCALYLSHGLTIFEKYEKIVTFFAGLSLILYFLVMLFPPLASFFKSISVAESGLMESNILVYGVAPITPSVDILMPRRNMGFAWEPGRYSVIIVIALFINMMRTNMKFKGNRNFWILLATLVTTQSTTGYACMIIPLLAFVYTTKYKGVVIPISIALAVVVSGLSFMGDKITSLWNWQDNIDSNYSYYIGYLADNDRTYVPQRFEGIYYDWLNFKNDILFGYGQLWKNSYVNTTLFPGASIYCSDGIVQIFSACGIIIGSAFYYSLFRSSCLMSEVFSLKGKLFFMFLFLLVNCSYNFWPVTIFFTFISFWYYENCKYSNSNI